MKLYLPFLVCLFGAFSLTAQEPLRVINLGPSVNTSGNETAPLLLPEGKMLFSHMPHEDNQGRRMQLDEALMYIMEATVLGDGTLGDVKVYKSSLSSSRQHVGNTAFDARNETLYFTRCNNDDDGTFTCAIYTAQRNGDKWRKVKALPDPINIDGFTSTHPTISYTPEGKVLLYFVSNRPGGLGRLDIWYAIIEGDNISLPVNLGEPVNSSSNEGTPFYDNRRNILYFSSDRQGGMGGYDVYASHGNRNSFTRPVAMPQPINTPQNDMFYTVADEAATYGYLSSNRVDATFTTDSFCCNDLFMWTVRPVVRPSVPVADAPVPQKVEQPVVPDTIPLADNQTDEIPQEDPDSPTSEPSMPYPVEKEKPVLPSPTNPIVLYFDNDMPNPGSLDTVTTESYDSLVVRYLRRLPKYKEAWAEGRDSLAYLSIEQSLENFFANDVEDNYKRLDAFIWRIAEHLWNGHAVTITIRGFASPVSSSAYNANLSQRRIVSFVNYLKGWNQGNLRRSISSGLLKVKEVPFGSSTASKTVSDRIDDPLGSVYSIGAARERRVEIIDFVTE